MQPAAAVSIDSRSRGPVLRHDRPSEQAPILVRLANRIRTSPSGCAEVGSGCRARQRSRTRLTIARLPACRLEAGNPDRSPRQGRDPGRTRRRPEAVEREQRQERALLGRCEGQGVRRPHRDHDAARRVRCGARGVSRAVPEHPAGARGLRARLLPCPAEGHGQAAAAHRTGPGQDGRE
jgi:hypothetical protein